ncbi:MAG: VanZ family protein [Salinivirgaceae bacterium]
MQFSVLIRYNYKIILWSLVIAYLCFSPSDGFKKVPILIPHLDKVVHFIMFFILGMLMETLKIRQINVVTRIGLPLLGIVYGGLIELIQHFVIDGRHGDWVDWIADILGLFIGIGFVKLLPLKLRRLLA